MKSGDRCPRCPLGQLIVIGSRPRGEYRIRYLGCDMCGARAGKVIAPEHSVRRRRKRVRN